MNKARASCLALIVVILFVQINHAQDPTVREPVALEQRSIADATDGTFVSKEGLFQIGINFPFPSEHLQFDFREGEIRIGYFDYPFENDHNAPNYFQHRSEEFESDTLANIPGRIVSKNDKSSIESYDSTTYFAFDDGRFGIERYITRKKRLYVLLAVVNSFLDKGLFERVLDSFEITGDVDPAELVRTRMDLLTWRPFPQAPVIKGQNTDLVDNNLKGPVAKVMRIFRDNEGNKTGVRSISEYDRRGYLIRSTEYGIYEKPIGIDYWGFLDGKRVMKRATVFEKYSLFNPTVVDKGPADAPDKYDAKLGYDARYWQSRVKRYQGGKLVETVTYDNHGKVLLRSTLEYRGGRVITTVYLGIGEFNNKRASQLDNKGNEIDQLMYSGEDAVVGHEVFSYKYDRYENWTTKSIFLIRNDYGREHPVYQFSEYREIVYY